jgi:TetR/AcrR family transcriptional regulator, ethionamide resistance regulator
MGVMPAEPDAAANPTVSRRARRMREAPRRVGDVKEAALLDVARDLVQSGEFQDAPIAKIAKQAGVSRQGFYFYYQSKDELLAQLIAETLYSSQIWRDTLYEEDWSEPIDAMHRQISSTIEMWRRNREILRSAVEVAPRSPAVWARWAAIVDETADYLVDMIVASTKLEALREPDEARRTMTTLIWMIERNCYVHVVHGSDESDADLAARMSDIYIRALGVE